METRIKGVFRGGEPSGTSLKGEIEASYADLVALLGEPQYKVDRRNPQSDGKCSTEWNLTCDGRVFTLYDYKKTSLYDPDLPSPAEFRALPSYSWHIGARDGVEPFLNLLESALAGLKK